MDSQAPRPLLTLAILGMVETYTGKEATYASFCHSFSVFLGRDWEVTVCYTVQKIRHTDGPVPTRSSPNSCPEGLAISPLLYLNKPYTPRESADIGHLGRALDILAHWQHDQSPEIKTNKQTDVI